MRRLGIVLLLTILFAGCAGPPSRLASPGKEAGTSKPAASQAALSVPSADPASSVPSGDPYVALARVLHARGVQIWWETDLVASWQKGRQTFEKTMSRLGALAKVPGVVGFKVADEMGYHDGLDSAAKVTAFLRASRDALSQVAPGKKILVDMYVPELGCVGLGGPPEADCISSTRQRYPGLSVPAVTSYLRSGTIDTFDLSAGLLDPSQYDVHGTTQRRAEEQAWARVDELGWARLTTLQARKALAEPGGYSGSSAQAASDVGTYVDAPVEAGARAVDVWTWRQLYEGNMVSLLAPGLLPNPLWLVLRQRKQQGDRFFTNMTPSAMPENRTAWTRECDVAAQVFDAVFVAAGTG